MRTFLCFSVSRLSGESNGNFASSIETTRCGSPVLLTFRRNRLTYWVSDVGYRGLSIPELKRPYQVAPSAQHATERLPPQEVGAYSILVPLKELNLAFLPKEILNSRGRTPERYLAYHRELISFLLQDV